MRNLYQSFRTSGLAIREVFGIQSTFPAVLARRHLSNRWTTRQGKDRFAKEAKVQGLKSRAAFKLLQINEKYRLFKAGQTVVDLGYAPGSWSQVAVDRTQPGGRVLGVDIIPTQPPKGVSTIQGNFLDVQVQKAVQNFLRDPSKGRPRTRILEPAGREPSKTAEGKNDEGNEIEVTEAGSVLDSVNSAPEKPRTEKTVDVILSDMSAPWEQTSGFWKRSLSDPYHRMMNTSGMPFRDHAGSMDLCRAALDFSVDNLRDGGHFVCKFYQGAEDKLLEIELKRLFQKVHRDKPEASRSESKEAYFIGLRRKSDITKTDVFGPE